VTAEKHAIFSTCHKSCQEYSGLKEIERMKLAHTNSEYVF